MCMADASASPSCTPLASRAFCTCGVMLMNSRFFFVFNHKYSVCDFMLTSFLDGTWPRTALEIDGRRAALPKRGHASESKKCAARLRQNHGQRYGVSRNSGGLPQFEGGKGRRLRRKMVGKTSASAIILRISPAQ